MDLTSLSAVSPVDGRYANTTASLREYFSEFALIKYRFAIEATYFIALVDRLPQLAHFRDYSAISELRKRIPLFSLDNAQCVKDIEKEINHDVKSVENYMRDLLVDYPEEREFIHFALTSFDTDGMARPLMLKDAHINVIKPLLMDVLVSLDAMAKKWHTLPMLAHTHGQPASPTTLGKEINVFIQRLNNQIVLLDAIPWSAKFGGATGNLNAHYVAYPDIDWHAFADSFITSLGLVRTKVTTQIEPYDNLAAYCHALMRINTILIDFVRDIWTYIMLEYLKQKPKLGEVGSSTMPHKVNPIDFENAEGNLGFANAMLDHFAAKLPISRLQRDLSDSTVIRNMGVPLAHMMIAFNAILKGNSKIDVNSAAIDADLGENWAVLAEPIQIVLRREKYPNAYEALKKLTRTGQKVSLEQLHAFIESLDIRPEVKEELKCLTPWNYIGVPL